MPRWLLARERVECLMRYWPDADDEWSTELAAHFDLLADLSAEDFQRLVSVVDFLYQRGGVGLRPRQLPISGVHSKWLSSHRGVVTAWLGALHGRGTPRGFTEVTGIVPEPDRLRMRILDPALAKVVGGLSDLEAPFEQIARLPLEPRTVLVVENLESGLACEPLPGLVVLMGKGYAVDRLADIPWLTRVPVLYWGDIDTHGFAILNRVRGLLPCVESVLMDRDTLLRHQDLWVTELQQHGGGPLDRLEEPERSLYEALLAGEFGPRLRLEQERLPWDHAWSTIRQSLRSAACASTRFNRGE